MSVTSLFQEVFVVKVVKLFRILFGPKVSPPPPKLRRAVLQVERLEDRECPAEPGCGRVLGRLE